MKMPEWLQFMTTKNVYFGFHVLGGGIGGAIGNLIGLPHWITLTSIVTIALLWEVFEYLTMDSIKIYGSKKQWFFDSLGDVLGATICCVLVIFF